VKRPRAVLVVLLVLVVLVAALVVQRVMRLAPGRLGIGAHGHSAGPPSGQEIRALREAQDRFVLERALYLELRNSGAPAEEQAAQHEKLTRAVEELQAIGGREALVAAARSNPTRIGGGGAPGGGASRRPGRAPGGPTARPDRAPGPSPEEVPTKR